METTLDLKKEIEESLAYQRSLLYALAPCTYNLAIRDRYYEVSGTVTALEIVLAAITKNDSFEKLKG